MDKPAARLRVGPAAATTPGAAMGRNARRLIRQALALAAESGTIHSVAFNGSHVVWTLRREETAIREQKQREKQQQRPEPNVWTSKRRMRSEERLAQHRELMQRVHEFCVRRAVRHWKQMAQTPRRLEPRTKAAVVVVQRELQQVEQVERMEEDSVPRGAKRAHESPTSTAEKGPEPPASPLSQSRPPPLKRQETPAGSVRLLLPTSVAEHGGTRATEGDRPVGTQAKARRPRTDSDGSGDGERNEANRRDRRGGGRGGGKRDVDGHGSTSMVPAGLPQTRLEYYAWCEERGKGGRGKGH